MQDIVTTSMEISFGSCLEYSAAATRRIAASSTAEKLNLNLYGFWKI
jgi:hypothetical protein